MSSNTSGADPVAVAEGYGIAGDTARAVVAAYARLATRTRREWDPASWSKTVWLAEAARWERAASAEAHYALLLHLQGLREQFEEKVSRGARAWAPGPLGERLTKR